jgi:hypothetical protein
MNLFLVTARFCYMIFLSFLRKKTLLIFILLVILVKKYIRGLQLEKIFYLSGNF